LWIFLGNSNERGYQIDVAPEKGQEYQAVRIFGKDNLKQAAIQILIVTGLDSGHV
jgi:hypothetical protein